MFRSRDPKRPCSGATDAQSTDHQARRRQQSREGGNLGLKTQNYLSVRVIARAVCLLSRVLDLSCLLACLPACLPVIDTVTPRHIGASEMTPTHPFPQRKQQEWCEAQHEDPDKKEWGVLGVYLLHFHHL